jgi:hypothetical protein
VLQTQCDLEVEIVAQAPMTQFSLIDHTGLRVDCLEFAREAMSFGPEIWHHFGFAGYHIQTA